MMSWPTVFLLSAGAYIFKTSGLLALSGRQVSPSALRLIGLLPPALFMALIVVQTLGRADGALAVDARMAGLLVAAIAVWRRAPFLVVVGCAVVAAAMVRAVT